MELSEIMEDAIISDGRERKIVRDGKAHPITEEEYRKLYPLHKDVGCEECTLVADTEDILLYFVPQEMKNRANKNPIFLGTFCLPNHTDHRGFYLFRCDFCSNVNVSYVCGGGRRLWCPYCKQYIRLDVVRYRYMFIKEDLSEEALEHYKRKDRIRVGFFQFLREYLDF